MKITLRPTRLPEDLPVLAAMRNLVESEPITAEEMGRRMERTPADQITHRISAVDEEGRMVGMGVAWRTPADQEGRWFMVVRVLPEVRGSGVGSTLLEALETWCREQGGTVLGTEVREADDHSVAFAKHRGYQTDRHIFESTLDLATFDETRFAGTVEGLEAEGIRIVALADMDDQEAWARKVHALVSRTVFDIPGVNMAEAPDYTTWSQWAMDAEACPRDCFLLALDGDRVAGVTFLEHNRDTGAMYTGHTSVDREYRGRKLALALKLASVETARRYDAPYMRTNNDAQNAPMLAVNRKMGYRPEPGFFLVEKRLG